VSPIGRWTLTGFHTEVHEEDIVGKPLTYTTTPSSIRPILGENEQIPVREDIITEEDVEAVAVRLFERDLGASRISKGPMCEGFKDEARTLLGLVLGSDKESEDA
jgi:hypothetical protein